MPPTGPDVRADYLQNTHDAYRLFYTILLTIGLSLGFTSMLSVFRTLPVTQFETKLPIICTFAVFLFVVLRFFLGGVRHLDATYIEIDFDSFAGSPLQSQRYRALDVGLLMFNAAVIITLGGLVRVPNRFFVVLAALLFVDAVWALLVSYLLGDLTDSNGLTSRTKWGLNNGVHFVVLVIAILLSGWPVLVVIGLSNSVIDFIWTTDSYFPPL